MALLAYFQTAFCAFPQASLEPDLPTSASLVAGDTGVCHHAWLDL
jgi:hypothetical protein